MGYVFMSGHVSPVKRGFFCDDQSLKHPVSDETISVGNCVLLWAVIGIFLICSVEAIFFRVHAFPKWEAMVKRLKKERTCFGRVPMTLVQIYRILGYFAFGAVATLLTTELAKYQVGRLRPYFLSACKPVEEGKSDVLSDKLCKDENQFYIFVTNYTCTGDAHEVIEARKSFLSGHSSFSFYTAVFLILYLQAVRQQACNRMVSGFGLGPDYDCLQGMPHCQALPTVRPFR